jgi:hypothetical protein
MKKRTIKMVCFPFGAILIVAIFGLVAMWLWNWLIPPVFGGVSITFLQAVGLLVLSRLFFGHFPGKPPIHRRLIREKWMRMTPEERREFIFHRFCFGRHFGHDFFTCEESGKDDARGESK